LGAHLLGFGNIVIKAAGAMIARLNPAAPAAIATALARAQFDSVRRQVPMLLFVAMLNTLIIMAVCAHEGLSFGRYGWMSLLIIYCLFRLLMWSRLLKKTVTAEQIPRLLKMNVGASLLMISLLGVDAAVTYMTGMFNLQLLIPVSLSFGSMAIAHCLYSLRLAAIGAIVMGLFPSALAMLAIGDFEAKMLGLSTMSVGVLMIRFVIEQYRQLIQSLLLEEENRQLAHTDPLTGIANRRAIMAALEAEAHGGNSFAVALLDLDGFKEVNDDLGHHAGDLMLGKVSDRLVATALAGDTVGRLGGDEFILLWRNVDDDFDVSARATAMLAALCQPVEIEGHVLPVAASMGYAMTSLAGPNIDALLHQADKALYRAKRQRKTEANAPAARVRQVRRA
jgi:diguanylate cyclase